MPAVIDKALDFIGGMNTSEPVPQSMDESTAKGILKYLKELGVPATPADVAARGQQQGWSAGFTDKVAEWAERVAAGERLVIKHPEFFSTYMREELRAWCNRRASTPPLQLNAFPYWEGILLLPSIAAARALIRVMSVLSRWASMSSSNSCWARTARRASSAA